MSLLLAVSKSIDWVTEGLGRIMYWLTLFMVLVGAFNVITRYFGQYLGVQLSGNVYLELQTYLFDLIFWLAAAHVLRHNAHVRVDMFYAPRSPRTKALIDIFGALLLLIPFCILGMYFSWGYVARSWGTLEVSPNPGGLARYPMKTVIIVGFALLILQGISETIKNFAFVSGRRRSGSIHETVTKQTEAL